MSIFRRSLLGRYTCLLRGRPPKLKLVLPEEPLKKQKPIKTIKNKKTKPLGKTVFVTRGLVKVQKMVLLLLGLT